MMFFNSFVNHKISSENISSMTDEDLFSLFAPSSFLNDAHETKRVILVDYVEDAIIEYYNTAEAKNGFRVDSMANCGQATKTHRGMRYYYHGHGKGSFYGSFCTMDGFYRSKTVDGDIVTIDSIPRWNLAHFFCDYLDSDNKTTNFVLWVYENGDIEKNLKQKLFHSV